MNVGVTGSVGFLGSNLVRFLLDNRPDRTRIIPYCHRRTSNPLTADLGLRNHQQADRVQIETLRAPH